MSLDEVESKAGPLQVLLAIPTYKRPAMLGGLLTHALSQTSETNAKNPAVRVSVLVVDNDPDRSGADVAAGHSVRYLAEPKPGIAAVRNRVLADAADKDALIFIDDDELPEEGWLDALIDRFLAADADAVAGKVITVFPPDTSEWIRKSGAFVRPVRADGAVIQEAATNNLLLDLRTVRSMCLSFDERFGLTGGSDSLFTRQMTKLGARIVWAEHAVVIEQEDPTRLTRSWILKRTYRFGNTKARVNLALAEGRQQRAVARLTMLGTGGIRIIAGSARFLLGVMTKSIGHRGHGERTVSRGRGMLAGAFGRAYDEYGLRRAAMEAAAESNQ